ncbi:RHS repeat-associated core domain-containing protein [Pinirhizobacter soli]|uniref:RHS repeat-associated core domain-containing protein n=1 Tax=Pinirhizobacter soli TaxID=2786953 RepID=UPI002029C947|nr:RHS repeat-associated core domain-containing protein [Pinirhizobacter soli]
MGSETLLSRSSTRRLKRGNKMCGDWQRICLLAALFVVSTSACATERVSYYYTDQQGTPVAVVDGSSGAVSTMDYRPYGSQTLGQTTDGPGYTGHVADADSGLIYMQARFYDPSAARFASADPVAPSPGNAFSFNRYGYADNNPIAHTDPDGRCIWDGCIVEIAVVGAILGGAIDAGAQKYFHPNQPINKTEVGISMAGGAITGGSGAALAGAAEAGTITVGQAVLRQAAVSGTVGAGQSVAGNIADGKPVSGQAAVNAAGANIVGSVVTSGISLSAGDFSNASTAGALQEISNAAVNTPAGLGGTIANTTRTMGNVTQARSAAQAAASQSARFGDVTGTVVEKELNDNKN